MRAGDRGERDERGRSRGSPRSTSLAGASPSLAHGELTEEDARELKALKEQIQARLGLLLRRRTRRSACGAGWRCGCARRGVQRYGEYAELLERTRRSTTGCSATVTINVSKFFRNAEVWDRTAREVVPALFALDDRAGPDLERGVRGGRGAVHRGDRAAASTPRAGLDEPALGASRSSAPTSTARSWSGAPGASTGNWRWRDAARAARTVVPAPARHRLRDEIREAGAFEPLDLLTGPVAAEAST